MTRMIQVRTERESILVEQFLAMTRELERVSDDAPDGQVLAIAELAALRAGRELTRRVLEDTLRHQTQPAEQKGLPAGPAPAAGRGSSRTRRRGG